MANNPSESPFDRLGRRVIVPNAVVLVDFDDTAFSVAHVGYGEWRNWRRILEKNISIQDPTDLQEAFVDSLSILSDDYDGFGLPDQPKALYAAMDGGTTVSLRLVGDFGIQASHDAGTTWSSEVFYIDGALEMYEVVEGTSVVRVNVRSETQSISFTVSQDAWLLFWIIREFDVLADIRYARTTLVV